MESPLSQLLKPASAENVRQSPAGEREKSFSCTRRDDQFCISEFGAPYCDLRCKTTATTLGEDLPVVDNVDSFAFDRVDQSIRFGWLCSSHFCPPDFAAH